MNSKDKVVTLDELKAGLDAYLTIRGGPNYNFVVLPTKSGDVAIAYNSTSLSVSGNVIAVSFPSGLFSSAPTVVASTGAGQYRTPIYVEDVTKNGFNIYKDSSSSEAIWIRWIAIGK